MVDDLAKLTREQARKDCKTIYAPSRAKGNILLSPVKLQISETPTRLDSDYDDTGHYCRRKDFERMYKQPRGNITDQEMLERAKQQAKEEAKNLDEKDRVDHIDRNGNIIAVIGNPGIGKTTTAKKWGCQFLSGELMTSVTFLFVIMIREINFVGKTTLLKLLSSILLHWKHSEESDEFWLKQIVSDRNVVIILDGLDEANVDEFTKPASDEDNENAGQVTIGAPLVNAHEPAEPFHILLNLISGKLLPYAKIIVTSRPNQFYRLHPNHRPKFVVEILGLDEEARNKLGRQICRDKYKKIQDTLEKNSSLAAYCYVPVNFILTIFYLMENSSDTDFVSITKVLLSACGNYSHGEHLKGKNAKLAELSNLAYTGFCNGQIIFQRDNFKQAGLDDITVDSCLSTSLAEPLFSFWPTIMARDTRTYFSHLVWQEFFVAVNLMMVASGDEFEKALKHLFDDRWEVVSRCLYGFCNSSVMKSLEGATNISCEISLLKKKSDLLMKEAASYLEQLPPHQVRKSNEHETSDEHKVEFREIQIICNWIHEANETDINEKLVPLIPDHISIGRGTILPSDISNLFFVVESFSKSWKLEVDDCTFSGNTFERFCSEASRLNTLVGPRFFDVFLIFQSQQFNLLKKYLPDLQ